MRAYILYYIINILLYAYKYVNRRFFFPLEQNRFGGRFRDL
jgi:hypothetical protein